MTLDDIVSLPGEDGNKVRSCPDEQGCECDADDDGGAAKKFQRGLSNPPGRAIEQSRRANLVR